MSGRPIPPGIGGPGEPGPYGAGGRTARVLLLGGTSEARELAALLVGAGVDVTSSLAGRVARPRLPVGKVRIGGFGGVAGLRTALADYDLVVDATHPFALGMSANAVTACTQHPLLRLERPGWDPTPPGTTPTTTRGPPNWPPGWGSGRSSPSAGRSLPGSSRPWLPGTCSPAWSTYRRWCCPNAGG